jgi:hypothetical protein
MCCDSFDFRLRTPNINAYFLNILIWDLINFGFDIFSFDVTQKIWWGDHAFFFLLLLLLFMRAWNMEIFALAEQRGWL